MPRIELRGKAFFFTFPQCNAPKEEALRHLEHLFTSWNSDWNSCDWIVAQENHTEEGLHIHAYVHVGKGELRKKIEASTLNLRWGDTEFHPNVQAVRCTKHVIVYCAKDGDWIAKNPKKVEKMIIEKERQAKKIDKGEIAELLISGKKTLDELTNEYPVLLWDYERLKRNIAIYRLDKNKVKELDNVCGIWIWGPAGCGKSHISENFFGECYIKGWGTWWDGYNGQETVVLPDLGKSKADIAEYLKLWADKWKFKADIKGGTLEIRPKRFIVTSNIGLCDYLSAAGIKSEDMEPWTRRFTEFYISSYDDWMNQWGVHTYNSQPETQSSQFINIYEKDNEENNKNDN